LDSIINQRKTDDIKIKRYQQRNTNKEENNKNIHNKLNNEENYSQKWYEVKFKGAKSSKSIIKQPTIEKVH